ncbi:choice-of-anchor I family protein [Winogradskyella sp. DF17]|uniref:Choice-of-anchor I family protein n=1 Tax=Winogradskyella pelagia TaxID=2819984 RepID=A0ABS3T487_9FLAO|nr:choice-of-anchor I family protein [Winogradskyella sp. DF17]MBO3117084.1 choice-of-anchor I family protein [Winogradskyella sp. DF17]
MKNFYFEKIMVFIMILLMFSGAKIIAQNFELQLLHYSDVDGNEESALDAVDEFSALVDFFKNDPTYSNNTLTVTSGDLIIPGPRYFAAENSAVRSLTGSNEPGHVDIAFANIFGVDVSSFGNHEFDQGPGELFDSAFNIESNSGVTFPGSNFPWLSTNIDFSSDGDFSGIIGTDGNDISTLNNQVAKYAVVTIDGETIGIVGAVAPSFPNITTMGSLVVSPSPGTTVNDLAAEIQTSVDALTNSGVNKIVLLAHMQAISIEKQLASLLDGVDIIVAGGSNTRMGDSNDTLFSNSFVTDAAFDEAYPFQTTDAGGDPVLVVNVDGDYKYLGRLVVEFDSNGILDISALDDTINGVYPATETLVNSLSATPNPDVVAIRDAVQGVITAQFSNVVGFASVYLDGRRSQVRTQETNLGNLTADANLWYANLLNPAADADVDISLKNGGGIRTEIGSAVLPGGSNDPNDIVFSPPTNNEVSEGNLRATLRFDNGLVRLTMTPAELITIIEHGLAEVAPGATPGRFPQIGGMSFVYDPNRPAGSRLVSLVVDRGDADPTNDVVVVDNGVNVAPGGITFNMVTLNFLANGGDSYPFDQLSAPNRINYYSGLGFGETVDFPDGDLGNDPGNNSTFSNTGGEQDAVAEYMSTFHPDNASAYDIAETDADQDTRIRIGMLPVLTFSEAYDSVSENGSSITLTVSISEAPGSEVTVEVALVTGGSAVEGSDFTYPTMQTLTFPAGSSADQTLNIPIIDNGDDGSDIFFVVELQNASGATIGSANTFSAHILDDDTVVPAVDSSVLNASYLASYLVDANGTAEITAYDPSTQRLFVTNSTSIEVLDFSDPSNITPISSIALPPNTDGVQSVAVSNGILAAAIAADPKTDPGMVMFSDTDGNNQVMVTAGALPDMLTFTPDGTKLLVANEGEPNNDYTIDPEGGVSIIDVTGGLGSIDQSDVTNLGFTGFNGDLAALLAADVRIFGPGANVAQDVEPEYIAVSDDSQTAYVVLQENNAYAIVDLTVPTITQIVPFGLKDHSIASNSLDTSDEQDFIFNASWPIYGMYMPDGIDYYNVGGTAYIVTANEGDAREYDTYEEERKLDDSDYNLDPAVFPNASILELENTLGDINVSNASGNTDGDPEFEEIHVYGARSFSIFEANSGNIVYDSGNDFEVITAADATYGGIFNASNSNNNFKNRSDNKGPEPEAVIVEEIEGSFYAFVLLERIGGVMIYDVTDPNAPVFLQYLNSRGNVEGDPESGDLGPEGIVYVNADDSPTGTALIVISNEVSATLSIYSLDNILSVDDNVIASNDFRMFPNPTKGRVNFSHMSDYKVYDISGRMVTEVKNSSTIDLQNVRPGLYIIENALGITKKLLVE